MQRPFEAEAEHYNLGMFGLLSQGIGDQEAEIRQQEDAIKRCEADLKAAHAQRNALQDQRRELFKAEDTAKRSAAVHSTDTVHSERTRRLESTPLFAYTSRSIKI